LRPTADRRCDPGQDSTSSHRLPADAGHLTSPSSARTGVTAGPSYPHAGPPSARRAGRLDILHNNAALTSVDVIGRGLGWTEFDPALFERVLRVNLVGYAIGAHPAIPQMISRLHRRHHLAPDRRAPDSNKSNV
jgi:NAD(P)-dependent dehydrogenase (short-subunit alcohol dehydrogenase family)